MNWKSSAFYIFEGTIIAWDVGAGLFSLRHHHYTWGIADVAMALGLGMIVFGVGRGRRRREERELREAEEAVDAALMRRSLGMTNEEMEVARMKARANLNKIANALGVVIQEGMYAGVPNVRVEFFIKGDFYIIMPGHIYRTRNGVTEGTCFNFGSGGALPYDEYVASALLLVRHDPTIFDRWRRQDNFYA